ncbi:MAG TPA: serine protease [Candidatus Sumerlaeota bacterium]|nr:serine protease [Candidatus Sumerlaeota bacterium]
MKRLFLIALAMVGLMGGSGPGVLARPAAERNGADCVSSVCRLASEDAECSNSFVNDHAEMLEFQKQLTELRDTSKTLSRSAVADLLKQAPATCNLPVRKLSWWKSRPDTVSLYEKARQSVVMVGCRYKCEKCSNWHYSTASGFALSADGVVATNYHVMDREKEKGDAFAVRTWDGKVYAVTGILAANKSFDLAILKTDGKAFRPLPVAEQAPVGTPVYVISHPTNHFYVMTDGIVSHNFIESEHQGGAPGMAITADYAGGSSGGPILNADGAVVGMVRATSPEIRDLVDFSGSKVGNIQMVWKLSIPSRCLLEVTGNGARR